MRNATDGINFAVYAHALRPAGRKAFEAADGAAIVNKLLILRFFGGILPIILSIMYDITFLERPGMA
jgi:hypothetical protein